MQKANLLHQQYRMQSQEDANILVGRLVAQAASLCEQPVEGDYFLNYFPNCVLVRQSGINREKLNVVVPCVIVERRRKTGEFPRERP